MASEIHLIWIQITTHQENDWRTFNAQAAAIASAGPAHNPLHSQNLIICDSFLNYAFPPGLTAKWSDSL